MSKIYLEVIIKVIQLKSTIFAETSFSLHNLVIKPKRTVVIVRGY